MIDVLLWYVWMQAFGLGGSLLARSWLSNLADRGYGVGKALGILLGAYAYWMFVTLGWAHNNIGAVLMALAAIWLGALIANNRTARRSRFRFVLSTEILFALAFSLCALFRAYTPDIVSAGGEKFMESLMLNAIQRSSSFPPNDAWMSGFAISYYYFGYIMQAMLNIASGVAPGIAFNLSGAMTFALTMTSAFSVGVNLWGLHMGRGVWGVEREANDDLPRSTLHARRSTIFAGFLTAAMLGLMGNMGGLMGALKCVNALPQSVWQWLDVYHTAERTFTCDAGFIPRTDFYSWWWDWARVVKDYLPNGQPWDMITESPIFSFVLGDNHPHVLALPFVLLAVAIAIHFATACAEIKDRRLALGGFALTAIVVGGLSFLNTWDFPVFGSLIIGGLLLAAHRNKNHPFDKSNTHYAQGIPPSGRNDNLPVFSQLSILHSQFFIAPYTRAALQGIAIMVVGYLAYLPFYATFSSQARGIGINLFSATRLPQFVLMFAPFLVIALGYGWQQVRANGIARAVMIRRLLTFAGIAIGGCVVAVLLFGLVSRPGRELLQELQNSGQIMGIPREQLSQKLLERAANPWTALVLIGFIAVAATQLFAPLTPIQPTLTTPADTSSTPHDNSTTLPDTSSTLLDTPATPTDTSLLSPAPIIVAALFAAGAILTLAPEFIFLQDLFGNRMNTIFKFYYQAWTLWSVAGAFGLMSLWNSAQRRDRVFAILGSAVVGFGLLWVVMAPLSKTNQFAAKPTLDGAAYLQYSNTDDAAAIDWLNQNVKGDPVILEANRKAAGYDYVGRISTFTGLPSVLGWGGHENQWRGNYDEPGKREPLIEQLYNTTDPTEMRNLITQFNVRYVIVGETERNQYTPDGLGKFDQLCTTAFKKGNTVIYACQ